MAVRALTSNGTFTTGTWNRVEASSTTWDFGNGTYDALTTERTINVTFANNCNQVGIILPIRDSTTSSGKTLTIKLYEGAVLRTTDTFTEGSGNWVQGTGKGHLLYFPLTSYAVTTAGSTWSYKISTSSGGTAYWVRASAAGSYGYYVLGDASTAAPSSGDAIVLADGCTYTIDATQTWGRNDTTTYRSFWIGDNSKISCLTPAASYTVTLGGRVWISPGEAGLEFGTSAVPIPYAQQLIFDFSHATETYFFESSNGQFSGTTDITSYIKIYGEQATNHYSYVASDAASGQADVELSTDMSGSWSATDDIFYIGYDHSTTVVNPVAVIDSMSGTTLTATTNLSYRLVAGGCVINTTLGEQMGIKFVNTNTSVVKYGFNVVVGAELNISGVHGANVGCGSFGIVNHNQVRTWRNFIVTHAASTSTRPSLIITETYATKNSSYRYIIDKIFFCNRTSVIVNQLSLSSTAYIDITDYFTTGGSQTTNHTIASSCVDITITGACIQAGYFSSSDCMMDVSGVGHTFTNVTFVGAEIGLYARCNASTFTNVKVERGYNGLQLGSGVGNKFINCSFGETTTATNYDIYCESDAFAQALITNAYIGIKGVANDTNLLVGSFVKFDTYDRTTLDHKTYQPNGKTQSTGSGLADTTVHTAGGYAIRFEPLSSTSNLEWEFTIPTGNIQNATMTVAVWCKIASATYYAGTHQLPRLTIDYDNGTETYAEAAESTDWQLLSVAFTPTTTYGQITVTLSGRTDATTTNAYVYWDDFSTLYPADKPLNTQTLDLWANALPVVPPLATVLSANDVWAAAVTSNVGSGTMGEKVGKKLLTTGKFIGLK